jgi:hypothetical protein
MASNNLMALCHPLPYGRRATPSKENGRALEGETDDYAAPAQGQRRDVGPAGPVTSVAIGPVRPSPPFPTPPRALHHHHQHCGGGGTGRQDAATSATVRPAASRQPYPRVNVRTATKQATPTSPPSKPLLDGYRARHDAPLDTRFARKAVYSVALYAMPLHVDK